MSMTDSFKQLLIDERARAPSALTEFLQSTVSPDTVVAFVEGDDDKYFYYEALRELSPSGDVLFIRCHNKVGVARAVESIPSQRKAIQAAATLFLCDRDYDEFNGINAADGVLLTRFYSIESYLLEESYLEHILGKFGGLSRKRDRVALSKSILSKAEMYSSQTIDLFAAMSIERQERAEVSFDEHPFSSYFAKAEDHEGLSQKLPRERIIERLGLDGSHSEIIERRITEFSTADFRLWMRGKHAWQFVKKICEWFHEDSEPARRIRVYFSKEGLREYVGACGIPRELKEYFEERVSLAQEQREAAGL